MKIIISAWFASHVIVSFVNEQNYYHHLEYLYENDII